MNNSSNNTQSLEQAKANVQAIIKDLTTNLSSSRQQMQELQINTQQTGQGNKTSNVQSTNGLMKKNLDLVDLAKCQVQHIVNEYFKDVSDNYILLQSKYPSNEIKDYVLKLIDNTLLQLNDDSQKINMKQFTSQDYQQFKSTDFLRLQDEIMQEASNLEQQTQNVQKVQRLTQDSLPQVKINHRVVEGLYLALNEYASTSWLGDLPKDAYDQPTFTLPPFFVNNVRMPLPVIDDEKSSYGYHNIMDGVNHTQGFTYIGNDSLHYQTTTVVTPQGMIYLMGGVDPQGAIMDQVHVLDPNTNAITKLAAMNVKRVGCSACYVPQQRSKGFIYVFGGRTNHMVKTKLCEVYDIEKNKWSEIPKMTCGQARPACCYDQINGDIYLFFGTDSNAQNSSVVQKFNLSSNTWSGVTITNYLPGFDITLGCALQINPDLIMIFGGMRDSLYFKEQMYFNRKVMLYNITNESFVVIDWQLPVDFLPLINPIIQNGKVYAIGTFLKSIDEQPQMFLDGAMVLVFDQAGPKVISYVKAYDQ